MSLDVLIPTLPQRHKHLQRLMKQVANQLGAPVVADVIREKHHTITITKYEHELGDVRAITCLDRKHFTVGKKRNLLKAVSTGDYLTYIDDDDELADNYFEEILTAIQDKPPLVTYLLDMYDGDRHIWRVDYHPRYTKDFETPANPKQDCELAAALEGKSKSWRTRILNKWYGQAHRIPNHLMVWRADLTRRTQFPDVNVGEDGAWAKAMKSKVKKVHQIDKVLYRYRFDANVTETQR